MHFLTSGNDEEVILQCVLQLVTGGRPQNAVDDFVRLYYEQQGRDIDALVSLRLAES